jgi:hypothetical protein
MEFEDATGLRLRLQAITASLLIGLGLMAGKFYAFWLTGSAAILSDALESIINVVAGAFAMGSIIFAAKLPDATHHYGHGKIEYFSAGGPSAPGPPPGPYSGATVALRRVTGARGTFWCMPLVVVATALILSTTSWPFTTLPNTA